VQQNEKTYRVLTIQPKRVGAFVKSYNVYYFTDTCPVKLNPEGQFELIFQVDGDFWQMPVQHENWEKRPSFFIGGLHNKSFYIKPSNTNSKLISVVFKPNCAKYFIPESLHYFKNRTVNLRDVFEKGAPQLPEKIDQSSLLDKAVALIEMFLLQVFTHKNESRIDDTVHTLFRSRGFASIAELAKQACLSDAQYRRRFNEEIGMSPKEYSKIVRVNYVSQLLSQQPEVKLTDLTYQLGYFDQAHFIKDFRSVTGVSPKRFLS